MGTEDETELTQGRRCLAAAGAAVVAATIVNPLDVVKVNWLLMLCGCSGERARWLRTLLDYPHTRALRWRVPTQNTTQQTRMQAQALPALAACSPSGCYNSTLYE